MKRRMPFVVEGIYYGDQMDVKGNNDEINSFADDGIAREANEGNRLDRWVAVGDDAGLGAFQLESTGIVLEEKEGRVSFTIQNTSQAPILLASQVEDLDNAGFSKNVLLSPRSPALSRARVNK